MLSAVFKFAALQSMLRVPTFERVCEDKHTGRLTQPRDAVAVPGVQTLPGHLPPLSVCLFTRLVRSMR